MQLNIFTPTDRSASLVWVLDTYVWLWYVSYITAVMNFEPERHRLLPFDLYVETVVSESVSVSSASHETTSS